MTSIKVQLKTIDQIHDFVNTISKFNFEIDLCSGRYQVNAKSIMGVCSLDLNQEVFVLAHTDQVESLMEAIKSFII